MEQLGGHYTTIHLIVWLVVNHVSVIIVTSILRPVHKPIIDSVLFHTDLAFTFSGFDIRVCLLYLDWSQVLIY